MRSSRTQRDSKAAKKKREERRTVTRAHGESKASKSDAKKDKRAANKQDEDDLDALLKEFRDMQATQTTVKEEAVPPPSPRANATLTAHPTKDELLLFGGERYDGKKNVFYADLYRYTPKTNVWKKVSCPNQPPPRSAHQAVGVPSAGGSLYVFGGEFSSTNQSQFHHYRDFWCLDLSTMAWEQVTAKNGPSARSGHRMAHVRDTLLVFGGFFDNLRDTRYYNDLYLFDLSLFKWTKATPSPGAPVPSPRAGFALAGDPTGGDGGHLLLYGGYFKKQVKMQQFDSHKDKSQVEELSDTGEEMNDLWKYDLATGLWETLKKSGTAPCKRSGYSMQLHKRRLIVFGGVHDEDTPDGEGLVSEFFNDLHGYSLEQGRWHQLTVNTPSSRGKQAVSSAKGKKKDMEPIDEAADEDGLLLLNAGGKRRNRNRKGGDDSDDDDALKGGADDASSQAGASSTAEVADAAAASKEGDAAATRALEPCKRMKPLTALRGNAMFVYGGKFEPEDAAEITLNDLWTLDLAKMDGWTCLHEGEAPEVSLVKEDDSEDDGEEDDDESEDESESESESDDDDDDEPKAKSSTVPIS